MREIIGSWYNKTKRVLGICYSSKGHVFLFPWCSGKKCAHLLIYNIEFISGKNAVEVDPMSFPMQHFHSFLKALFGKSK